MPVYVVRRAVEDLRRQIREYEERFERGEVEHEMGACVGVRINSGLFGVEWERTKEVLEGGGVDMLVLRPGEREERKKRDGGVADEEDEEKGKQKSTVGEGKKRLKRKGETRDEEAEEDRDTKAPKTKKPDKEVDSGGGKKQTRLRFGKV
ncbi:MAG: hypothetical protein Q9196_006706 [Gyalolechia fulgens]